MKETVPVRRSGAARLQSRYRSHQQLPRQLQRVFYSAKPISELICLGNLVNSFFIVVVQPPQRKPRLCNACIQVLENSDPLFRACCLQALG